MPSRQSPQLKTGQTAWALRNSPPALPPSSISTITIKSLNEDDDTEAKTTKSENDAEKRSSDGVSSPGDEFQDRVTWMGIVSKSASASIGVAGLKYAVNAKETRSRRWIWILLIGAAMCMTTYQIIQRIRFYNSFQKTVDVDIVYQKALAFPSIAICNFNKYRFSQIKGTPFMHLLESYVGLSPNSTVFDELEPFLNHTNMSTILRKAGHQMKTTVGNAYFGGMHFPVSENFTESLTDIGLCFMFNVEETFRGPLMTSAAGNIAPFHVLLDVQQHEYWLNEDHLGSAGFAVYLFEKGTQPRVSDRSFAISPGTRTLVGMEVKEIKRMPRRYGECGEKELKYFRKYGFAECMLECETDYVVRECDCKLFYMPGPHRECNPVEYMRCGIRTRNELKKKNRECQCPVQCSSVTYHPTISSALYPADAYMDQIKEYYQQNSAQKVTTEYVKSNMCFLTVYFQELAIDRIKEQAGYSFFGLLCDIGGSLGLWLGGSLLTLVEFCDLFAHSLCIYSSRSSRLNRNDLSTQHP